MALEVRGSCEDGDGEVGFPFRLVGGGGAGVDTAVCATL